jgi:uncharacterized protein (TIGR02118 family)
MTIKLVALYTRPDDPEAFEEYYAGTHMPLAAKVPGVQRAEAGRLVAALDGGEESYYRMAELYFADRPAFDAALATPEMKATTADYQKIAPPGSRMFLQVLD